MQNSALSSNVALQHRDFEIIHIYMCKYYNVQQPYYILSIGIVGTEMQVLVLHSFCEKKNGIRAVHP